MMSNRSLSYTVVAAGIGAALLSGCAAGSAAAGNSRATSAPSATTSANRPAATSTPAGSVTGTAPTAATTTPADSARALALRACTTWKVSDGQSAAEGSGTMDRAAVTARGAARSTPRWAPLASDMTFLASLPETDNTPADVAKAQQALHRVSKECAGIGVPGIHA